MTRVNQYKKQFKKWKLNKNVTTSKMHEICHIRKRRASEEGKDSEFRFRGRVVPAEKIDRFTKRQKTSTGEVTPPQVESLGRLPSIL